MHISNIGHFPMYVEVGLGQSFLGFINTESKGVRIRHNTSFVSLKNNIFFHIFNPLLRPQDSPRTHQELGLETLVRVQYSICMSTESAFLKYCTSHTDHNNTRGKTDNDWNIYELSLHRCPMDHISASAVLHLLCTFHTSDYIYV